MHPLDVAVLVAYLAGIVLFGAYFSKSHHSIQDYFVSGKTIPWWAILGSIVATETSTVTFISVPGYAYSTNFTFLQLVMGYMIGRLAVSFLFIPAYFKGELLTVYQLLGERFGGGVKRLASGVFLLTRSFADGFRLFATGLVLAAVLRAMPRMDDLSRAWFPSADPTYTILILSVIVMGIATVIYTYHGGMTAVIWTDVVQLVVYLIGAAAAAAILLRLIPGGWSEVQAVGAAAGKFRLFDFTLTLTKGYTFWSGVVGGAFLTTATHGTDQLMVQRYFCASGPGPARKALLWSGALVFAQFVLFLLIGAMLFVYYTHHAPADIAAFTQNGRVQTDRIFPYFIVQHLPVGIVGLVLAAIFAAAAGADGGIRRRADRRRDCGDLDLQPRRRRSARDCVVHQWRHPRRLLPRHLYEPRGSARRVHRDRRRREHHAGREAEHGRLVAVVRAHRLDGDVLHRPRRIILPAGGSRKVLRPSFVIGFDAASEILRQGIRDGAFPAASVEIGRAAGALWGHAFGALTYDRDAPPATGDTIFDLASLTKVIATTTLAMRAIDDGLLSLDETLASRLPEWRGHDREIVTIRDVLAHASGLPAYLPFFRDHTGRAEFEPAICRMPLEYTPRSQSVYSDLGFILLGFILQDVRSQASHGRLDPSTTLAAQFRRIASYLTSDPLAFNPPRAWREHTAPTEVDPWRGRLLAGEVHDENCWALGGAAGHSGLFGTAAAIGAFARAALRTIRGD